MSWKEPIHIDILNVFLTSHRECCRNVLQNALNITSFRCKQLNGCLCDEHVPSGDLLHFWFKSFFPPSEWNGVSEECDRAQTSNVSSTSKLSSECLVTYLCVLSAPEYFMMSKLLRKCSQRHPRVQCVSDDFWEHFKEPQVPLQWCLRRKMTPVSSSLSRFLCFSSQAFTWSSVLSQKN